jgi:WhiB family redox-sensing transcriptional regulator
MTGRDTALRRLLGNLDMGWRKDAACGGYPTHWFFLERAEEAKGEVYGYHRAREICAGCPVKEPCLEYALAAPNGVSHGMWGGTSPRERRQIRKHRIAVAKAEQDPYRKSIG